jgi:protein disulfide-isomerase A1
VRERARGALLSRVGLVAANLGEYVNDYVSGKLKAKLKSEEPPAKQEGPVTVIVGKTWDDIVKQDDKDVLVEFYAP